jgi:hypothetical protein
MNYIINEPINQIFTLMIKEGEYKLKYSKINENQIAVSSPTFYQILDINKQEFDKNFIDELVERGWSKKAISSLHHILFPMNNEWNNMCELSLKTGKIKRL